MKLIYSLTPTNNALIKKCGYGADVVNTIRHDAHTPAQAHSGGAVAELALGWHYYYPL